MNDITYGAGILFYCKTIDNTPYFFLGKDEWNRWANFGGRSESSDKMDPETTAIRETWEESLGAIGDITELKKLIKNSICILSKTPSGHTYYMYVVNFPFTHSHRDRFLNTRKFIKDITIDRKFLEMTDVKLISLQTIIISIENQKKIVKLRSIFEQTFNNNRVQIENIVR